MPSFNELCQVIDKHRAEKECLIFDDYFSVGMDGDVTIDGCIYSFDDNYDYD